MFVEIDGHRVFALSFGAGPRTFLAHSGWIGNVEDWLATLAPLSQTWRTIIYDHRGTGETTVPLEAITAEALRDDIFRIMEHFDIQRCVLGGFSAGTSIVLRAAVESPEQFDGLVLLNGTGGVTRPGMSAGRSALPPSMWPGDDFATRLQWFIEQCTPEPDVEHIRRWGQHILLRAEPDAADRLWGIRFAEELDYEARLQHFAMPTLLIHGERDVFTDRATMEYVASLIPRSRFVVVEGAGHIPAMTRPADVAAAINAFFLASGSSNA